MEQQAPGYGWYIRRIDNALAREANRNLQSRNLTMQQSRALVMLAHAPDNTLSLKELERSFGAAQSTVAGLASRLEKKGLVEAMTAPGDRRVKLLRLTPEGIALHQACFEDMMSSERELAAGLTPEELGTLRALLRKLHDGIDGNKHETRKDDTNAENPCSAD